VASFPAPEPPLTEEEKLLRRIVSKGNQQDIAMLNPQIRAEDQDRNEAEFERYLREVQHPN
jgi:hypothetical protein